MRIKAWVLCRISSKDQAKGNSLDSQEQKSREMLERRYGLLPHEIKVFREVFSGRKDRRPVFEAVMEFSRKHRHSLKYGCIFDIDRFSRAGASFYEQSKKRLRELGIKLVDAGGVIQDERNMLDGSGGQFGNDFEYEWSTFSPSEAAEIQRAHQANEEVRKILLRTVRQQINYVQEGYEGRQAIYGFRNVKILNPETGKKRATKEFEPNEARYIRMMFDLAPMVIAETMTINAACDEVNKAGYRSRTRHKWNESKTKIIGQSGGRKLDPKQFWRFVRNVEYAGFKSEKWTHDHIVESKSPRMIPIKLWNEANSDKYKIAKHHDSITGWSLIDLENRPKREYRIDNPDFPYKQLIRCPKCGKNMKAGASTGKSGRRFPLYFCNKGHKQVSINPTELEKVLRELFADMKFSEPAAEIFEHGLRKVLLQEIRSANQNVIENNRRINEMREQAECIFQKLGVLTNRALVRRCEEEYEQLMTEIALLESEQTEVHYTEEELMQMIRQAKGLVEHLDQLLLDTSDKAVLRGFWSCIFPENPTLEELKRENGRTPKVSLLVRLNAAKERPDGVWYTTGDSSRTLFDELIRWADILRWAFERSGLAFSNK